MCEKNHDPIKTFLERYRPQIHPDIRKSVDEFTKDILPALNKIKKWESKYPDLISVNLIIDIKQIKNINTGNIVFEMSGRESRVGIIGNLYDE